MIAWLVALPLVSASTQEGRVAIPPPTPSVNLGRVTFIRAQASDPFLEVRDVLLRNPEASKSMSDLYDTTEQREERLIRERAPVLDTLVKAFMRPELRPGTDHFAVTGDGRMVFSLDRERERWLESFMQVQRRIDCMLDLQFRFVEGARGTFDRYGLTNSASVIVSGSDLAVILKDGATLTAPRIVVWPRQQSSLSVLDKIAYVERWDVRTVEPNQQVIADPVIREAPDGVTMGVSAVVLEDALFGAIVDVEQSRVARPIPTRKVRLGTPDNREVEVAVPEITTVSLKATVMLRAGEIALFRAPLQDDAHDVAVLLSIRRVDPEPEQRR